MLRILENNIKYHIDTWLDLKRVDGMYHDIYCKENVVPSRMR